MIIFSRTIKWKLLRKERTAEVIASVNLDNQVHINLGGEGVTFSPQEAFALGRALVRASLGEGVPCGPNSPFTCND